MFQLILFHLPPAGRPGKGRAAVSCQRGSQWVGGTPREACVPGVTCPFVCEGSMCIGLQGPPVGRPNPAPAQGLLAPLPALAILSTGCI